MNSKWVPTIITVIVTVLGAFTPDIQAYVAHHPEAGVLVAGLYAFIKGLTPSPVAK